MARTREPEVKRERLLQAALEEFAAHGRAGARIDRIAKRAGVSAGLVYAFYAGKDELFEGVFDAIVDATVSAVPIDADDLGEYAGRLHDAASENPAAVRFLQWYALERGGDADAYAAGDDSMRSKLEAIADAQRRGTVSDRFTAAQTLAVVLTLASTWHTPEPTAELVPPADRRATVVEAVRRLVG